MKKLADKHLCKQRIAETGILSFEGVSKLFAHHEDPNTAAAERVQIDAVINHLIGVQVLHSHFIDTDMALQAQKKADELGWAA